MRTLYSHIPKCYRDACISDGFVPFCTCQHCKGERAHDGDMKSSPSKRSLKEEDDDGESSAPLTEKKQKTEKDTLFVPTKTLEGKTCVCCGAQKSPSALTIPIIHIGKHRELKICKKQHLNDEEIKGITKIIEQELEIVVNSGDSKEDAFLLGSQEENTDKK